MRMRPLVFLTLRSFLNGLKRALTSGRRLVSIVMFAAYYAWLSIGRFGGAQTDTPQHMPGGNLHLAFPALSVLDGAVFGFFTAASIVLALGIFGYRGAFRPADVDVLFPTPVSPKLVLLFRIARDYLVTLLLPLVFAAIGWRGTSAGLKAIVTNFPSQGGYVFRALAIAWLLLSFTWVCVGYATSLFVNRSDLKSERNRLLIGGTLLALLVVAGGDVAYSLRQNLSWDTALALSHSLLLRVIFAPATAATAVVMAPLGRQGINFVSLTSGLLGLCGLITLALIASMTQVGFMYDQAAARGFDNLNLRVLQRRGDMLGVVAEQARRGRVKEGRIAGALAKLNARGASALLWKDVVIQARSSLGIHSIFTLLMLFLSVMPMYASSELTVATGYVFLAMQGFGVWVMAMATAQSGFVELLRRVDVEKPLPFTPRVIAFWEVTSKVVAPISAALLGSIAALIVRPAIWPFALASVMIMPSLALLLVSVVLLVMLLFPDVDDSTQRGFRGLMMLLGIVGVSAPSVITAIVMFAFGAPAVAVACPVLAENVAIAVALCALSGWLYSGYNPTE